MGAGSRRIATLACSALLVLASLVGVRPAAASSVAVAVSNSGYSPSSVTVPLGGSVTWNFDGPSGQSVTGIPNLGIGFDSGSQPNGGTYTFEFDDPGTFTYRDGMTGYTGQVKVPMAVAPASATTATALGATWAASPPPAGDVFDVQMSVCPSFSGCPSDFGTLFRHVTSLSGSYTPQLGPGTYSFRSQLVDTSNGKASGWTGERSVRVSAASAGIGGLTPMRGLAGTHVTINGWDFTGATDVRFSGVSVGAGKFAVVSDSTITTAVPAGATSGPVTVATPNGTASSPYGFTVAAPAKHVVVIMMENEANSIIGSSSAPYLTSLAQKDESATQMFAFQHGSLADYIAVTSGRPVTGCGTSAHKTPNNCQLSSSNIVDQVQSAGLTWKEYAQDYPKPGTCDVADSSVGAYAVWHVPFLYYSDVTSSPARCANMQDLNQLSADLSAGMLPTYSFISPNVYTDMAASCTSGSSCPTGSPNRIRQGDDFLQQWVPQLVNAGAVVVITWDEGWPPSDASGCCLYADGGRIPTLVVGPGVPARQLSTQFDTYSILAGIDGALQLPFLGRASCLCSLPLPLGG